MKDSSVDKLAETLSLCILKKGKIKKKKKKLGRCFKHL